MTWKILEACVKSLRQTFAGFLTVLPIGHSMADQSPTLTSFCELSLFTRSLPKIRTLSIGDVVKCTAHNHSVRIVQDS